MIGRRLAHYDIIEKLGQGGMGEVYLARDTRLGREVAIKLLPADLAADAGRRARFEREAKAVAALNHPNVVTIHAVEEAEGRLFLVMERVRGVTLTRKIPASGLPLREFFQLALPLTEAVAAAHAAGITHRDLKPENVMVDDGGRLKILDFGLAKILEPVDPGEERTMAVQTREGVILGTAAYMSPEQAEGKPTDARSDVFTLGVLLYEMLTGRRPFSGDTQMSTLSSVLRDDPVPVVELRPELPRGFQRIVRRCLEKDPERRYESARGIHYDLEILREEILSGEYDPHSPVATVTAAGEPASLDPMLSRSQPPAGSVPPSVPPPAPAPGRRNRLGLLLAVFLPVIAAIVWFQWPKPEGAEPVAQPEAKEPPLVVVFPFENLGPPDDAYFADGITDEITTRLTSVEGLRVLSRTSATQYGREGKTLGQIASDLGVDYVLEGAVRWQRREGGPSRVRVTAQLVDAAAGVQLWAEPFDRDMDEIFDVQEEIAEQVVRRIGVEVGGESPAVAREERPTDDIRAYHLYLRANQILTQAGVGTLGNTEEGIALLDSAVTLDPDFAEAWGQMARGQASIVHFGWDQSAGRLEKARRAMERGMELDPDNATVQLGRGYYFYHGLKDYAPALEAFERAAAIQPGSAEIMRAIGYVLRRQGRFEEALDRFYRASELSPNDNTMLFDIGETLLLLRRYPEALAPLEGARRGAPDAASYWIGVGACHLLMGDPASGLRVLESFGGEHIAEFDTTLLDCYVAAGDLPAALALLERMPATEVMQFRIIARESSRAWVLRAMGVEARVPEAAAEGVAALNGLQAELGDHANLVSASAVARSLLGTDEAKAAVEDARRALELFPASRDVWIRSYRKLDLALVLMNAGAHEDAVDELRDVLEGPGMAMSRPWLAISPVFDPLRERADFQALLGQRD